jgi:transcriptional regulator with XRE-family HTH domain
MGYSDNSTLARIEQGKVDVYQNKIVQFAEVLGTTPAYLMGWEEEEETPDKLSLTEGEQMVLDLFRRVPEEQQKIVLEMIRAALGTRG